MNKAIIGGIIAAVAIGAFASAFLISPDSNTQPPTISHNEKLGLVINTPTSETTLQSLDKIFSKASSTGIGRSNVYMFWNIVEPEKKQYNWGPRQRLHCHARDQPGGTRFPRNGVANVERHPVRESRASPGRQ